MSSYREKSEVKDGMQIDWDVPIKMDDGLVLRADVFRPLGKGKHPVIMTYGPYAKWLTFEQGYHSAWNIMCREHPDVPSHSSNKYQSWEVVDPEKWVPAGYACVRVDSRGAGRSPGFIDHWSPRENKDFALCIDWAGGQPWSNGKVGVNGISYYAINAWHVAGLQPKHLAAICAWEGGADFYRDMNYHGGIPCTFAKHWYDMQVKSVQYGLGEKGPKSDMNGDLVCGPETFTPEQLAKNRCDFGGQIAAHPLDDKFHRDRSADWSKVKVPLLSCASWGGQGLHPRGNYEGFMRAASKDKWLEVHGLEHWTHFYTDYGRQLQFKFFDHFLKGADNGWDKQPRVQLQVRYPGENFGLRYENEWPIAHTQWTKLYLHPKSSTLSKEPVKSAVKIEYDAKGDGVTFKLPTLTEDMEICGPMAAKLFVSSETTDADLFLVVRVYDPAGKEVTFKGTVDPHTPIGQGWLRASHRKLDAALSKPWRPYHTHDEAQPLKPGEVVELDIEIWPSGLYIPKGYTLALTVRGKDYECDGPGVRLNNFKNELKGCGPFLHDERDPKIYGGKVTVHSAPGKESWVMLPVIPFKK